MATVGSILQVVPAVWNDQAPTNGYLIQRVWQWTRNGVDIVGATGGAYTLQDEDIGATITVREVAGFISPSNNGTTPETPSVTSSSAATGVSVTGSPLNSLLVQKSNLVYQGSFFMPGGFAYNGAGIGFNSNGTGAQKTITAAGQIGGDYLLAGEFSIPGLRMITDQASLALVQSATLLNPTPSPLDPTEGQKANSGVTGDSGYYNFYGFAVAPTSKLLFSYANGYPNSQKYSVFYRRPANMSSAGSVEGPFIVIDPIYQINTRWTAGWLCPIPSTIVDGVNYQTALGGDFLAGVNGLPIIPSMSDGPSAISFSSSAITAALATSHSGTARGGNATQIILADSASSANDYYVNQFIVAPSACTGARRIVAYDGSTRTATIERNVELAYWNVATPTNTTTYKTTPYVSGRQLIGYVAGSTALDDGYGSNRFASIWGRNGAARGMVIPNGTRSLLFIGRSGDGFNIYGSPGLVSEYDPIKIYDPEITSQAPHSYGYTGKIWAYDLAELAAVYASPSTVGFNSVKPYAVWRFDLPGAGTFAQRSCVGATYDPSARILYIAAGVKDAPDGYGYGRVAVHAYLVNNAVPS